MSLDKETCKEAWIANLKTLPSLTAIVGQEIRECEYQSTDWVYPCVRLDVDYKPSINGCGPDDAYVSIYCYSAEKSSKQSAHLASLIEDHYHKINFKQDGHMFSTVVVQDVSKSTRSIFAWETLVTIFCQGV
jgi:hypothetical protein